MKTQELEHYEVRTKVREQYGKVAGKDAGCGCAPTCCGRSPVDAAPASDAAAVIIELLIDGMGLSGGIKPPT